MRQRHLDGRLEGTLCHNCINDVNLPIEPLVPALATPVAAEFFNFTLPKANGTPGNGGSVPCA
jgi:hypothetical protein